MRHKLESTTEDRLESWKFELLGVRLILNLKEFINESFPSK